MMIDALTPAEEHVIALLARGYTYTEIAAIRYTAYKTVKQQVYSARMRMRARTVPQLIALYVREHESA